MFDEDGSLDPFLKFLLYTVVILGVAKTLWEWLTGDVARWFNADLWNWITQYPWWTGLTVGAVLLLTLLLRLFTADGVAAYDEPYEQAEDPDPVALTYRMKQLSAMTPTGFEQACAELLARDGFNRTLRVGGAGDLGADVVAYDDEGRILVLQCKQYARPVGSKEVQTFNGTARPEHGADLALMIGLNGFAQPAVDTDRVAVRQQYMDRSIPEFAGIPAPAVARWTAAHSDLHWANLTSPLRLLDWEGWGRAPEGFDAATLYAYTLLQEDVAARVREAFPVLGSPAGLAAEATVCAQLLQTVARGDNLTVEDHLRNWSEELRSR